ncbi:hypothetical protein BFX40_23630 [Mesorhizobium sp. SEMIA 3007]|uniref:hypothetical protein n=1 Tax=Mesorhizobium sp. SEMIA 3007 TaxID=1862350 RepID=UPI00083DBE9E|nr:hypothetical protein [Mesorhizobium sp. SEMIA 3007]ODA95555.1 hypothetical protein BFX40_23630 [Mesorhizobium sp. SEMIA 3007]
MKKIDHDADEPPKDRSGNSVFWAAGTVLALLWLGSLTLMTLDWHSVVLGAVSGGAFVAFVTEITGNKVPKWMRR